LPCSPEITDGRCFAGCRNNMTFCLWGHGVELLIDAFTMALIGQVKIHANLLRDITFGTLAHSSKALLTLWFMLATMAAF
jgi:hypothetical protein